MKRELIFDYSKAKEFISEEEVRNFRAITEAAKEALVEKRGAGNDFLGWVDLPENYDKEEFERIKAAARKIESDSDILLVIGIGGSYLGARAAIEFLTHSFYNVLDKGRRKHPQIFFCGHAFYRTGVFHVRRAMAKKDLLNDAESNFAKLNSFIALMTGAELSAPFDFSADAKKKEAH